MADGLRDPAAWNWAMVQSVGGGFVVSEDRLTFFVGSNSNTSGYTGTASLRRDGFASLQTGADPGEALTRPLRFHGSHFFVNANASAVRVEIARPDGVAIPPFTLANSRLESVSPQRVVSAENSRLKTSKSLTGQLSAGNARRSSGRYEVGRELGWGAGPALAGGHGRPGPLLARARKRPLRVLGEPLGDGRERRLRGRWRPRIQCLKG